MDNPLTSFSWKPIETYNKLGPKTPILLYDPEWYANNVNETIALGYWENSEKIWRLRFYESASYFGLVDYDEYTPKFWMPLPSVKNALMLSKVND